MAIIGYLAYYIAHTNSDHNDIVVGIGIIAIGLLLTVFIGVFKKIADINDI